MSGRGGRVWWWVWAGIFTLVGVGHCWPVAREFFSAIPYGYKVVPGYERVVAFPGDHLQSYYWFWLFVDNVLGPSRLFSNPYEFNTFLSPHGLALYANFPLSVGYLLLVPLLGLVGAYNAVVLGSYTLAGLAGMGLGAVMAGRWWGVLVGLVLALLPLRVSQAMAGHIFGLAAFVVGWILMCVEKAWRGASARWAAGAGLGLVFLAPLENHLVYYSTLLLGLYLPLRALADAAGPAPSRPAPRAWVHAVIVAASGMVVGVAMRVGATRAVGPGWGGMEAWAVVCGWTLVWVGGWLVLSQVLGAFTTLGWKESRALGARVAACGMVMGAYLLQPWVDLPHLGKVLGGVAVGLGVVQVWRGVRGRMRLAPIAWGRVRALWPLVPALVVEGGYLLWTKARLLDKSIAAGGRTLHDVLLFSPRVGDLFGFSAAHSERIITLGWVVPLLGLGAVGLLAADRPARAAERGVMGLWAGLGIVAVVLSLGPTLEGLKLYEWCYRWVPFFNFPRVPGRLVLFGGLMVAVVGVWALGRVSEQWARGLKIVLGTALAGGIVWGFWTPGPVGVCVIPPAGRVERLIARSEVAGPGAARRLLGLPIWPGDSHNSSAYELLITQTRAVMVNGYAPAVPRAYVQRIFWPLYPLDLGVVSPGAMQVLKRLNVGMIYFSCDDEVYTRKVCPFPPSLARRRLEASGVLVLVDQEREGFVYRLVPGGRPRDTSNITSPVTSLWEAEWLGHTTGSLVEERDASGWGLLFAEPPDPLAPLGPRLPRPGGNVVLARAGQGPGWLCTGPGKTFPPGRYVARFRLRRRGGGEGGWVGVVTKEGRVLGRVELTPQVLPADGRWHDVAVEFETRGLERLEWRCWYGGEGELAADVVLVEFAERQGLEEFYPAAQMWRQTGWIVADSRIPGGYAVEGLGGVHAPLYLMHGPQQTLDPGHWRAWFRVRRGQGEARPGDVVADLVVALDLGRITLGCRRLRWRELGPGYREIPVDFTMPRRAEVGLRVRFRAVGGIVVGGARIEPR